MRNYAATLEWNLWKTWLKWMEDVEGIKKEKSNEGRDNNKEERETFKYFPLQIANGIRIMKNDAVFIFDEVGCGKTISAGIMAATFFHNRHKDDKTNKILVITTNTVKENGQFKDDWDKVDPRIMEHTTIYNNLYNSDLKRLDPQEKWGLVIIDEAHEFHNTDTQRYSKLINCLKAEKVIFMTATPLRGGGDFEFYKNLSRAILGKEDESFEELDRLDSVNLKNEYGQIKESDLICAKFDPAYPVTRYFKDTVKYLDLHETKAKAHRVIPEIWKPEQGKSRSDCLAENIKQKIDKDINNKFIIFVRYKAEADRLKEQIKKTCGNDLSVDVIFSENKGKLKEYSKIRTDLPKVLIIGYQVGEAGVNLPGYNHVIHWHISSDPARLEQRYGRIDRLTSKFEKIYSIFVDSEYYDSNQSNFLDALRYTMEDLLTSLPARNVILTEKTMAYYKNYYEYKREARKTELENLKSCQSYLKTEGQTDKVSKLLLKCYTSEEPDFSNEENSREWNIIKNFIDKKQDSFDSKTVPSEELSIIILEMVEVSIAKKIRIIEKQLNDITGEKADVTGFAKRIEEIEKNSDKIFYLTEGYDPACLKTIGAQGSVQRVNDSDEKGCATYIEDKSEYVLLRDLVRLLAATGLVKLYAAEDPQFAAETIDELGYIAFDKDWNDSGCERIVGILGYKYVSS